MRKYKFRAWDNQLKQMYSHSELLEMTKDVVLVYKDIRQGNGYYEQMTWGGVKIIEEND